MDEAVPHHREAATVLHQLLDDVPMAALITATAGRASSATTSTSRRVRDASATAAPGGSTTA